MIEHGRVQQRPHRQETVFELEDLLHSLHNLYPSRILGHHDPISILTIRNAPPLLKAMPAEKV